MAGKRKAASRSAKNTTAASANSPAQQVKEAFGTCDLYQILNVGKHATAAAIRKAYFRLALTCHPDKCPGDAKATAKFQALSIVHAALDDEGRRKHYDETGEIENEETELNHSEQEWYDYWRNLFPTVTLEQIRRFQTDYQGSDEERQAVLTAYTECKGKMARIIDSIMLATDEDELRFREIIANGIGKDAVKPYKSFQYQLKDDRRRLARREKEAQEAEEILQQLQKQGSNTALAQIGRRRAEANDNLLARLELKYTKGGEGAKKKAPQTSLPDIDDNAFERIRAGLKRRK